MDDEDKEDMFVILNDLENNKDCDDNELNNGPNKITNQALDALENKLDAFDLEDQIINKNDEVDYDNQIADNDNNEQLNKVVDERLLSDENEEEEENDDGKLINFKEEVESNDNNSEKDMDKENTKDRDRDRDKGQDLNEEDEEDEDKGKDLNEEDEEDEDIRIITKGDKEKIDSKKHEKEEINNAQPIVPEKNTIQQKEENNEIEEEEEKKQEEEDDISILLNCNLNINEEMQKNEKINRSSSKIYEDNEYLRSKRLFKKTDFQILSILGTGSYAIVVKAQYQVDEMLGSIKAMKIMKKKDMEKERKLHQIYLENEVLLGLEHPNLVGIEGAFEFNDKIYIVLEYLSKGDFSDFLRMNHPLQNDTAKYYAAEIVNLLEYLRSKKVVHRDLKPENIMLDDNYHLKAIDFATAKIMDKYFNQTTMRFEDFKVKPNKEENGEKAGDIVIGEDKENEKDGDDRSDDEAGYRETRGHTFVGTAEYVSPEVLQDVPADYGTDLWALGCMIYQMYAGKTPYVDKNDYLIFQRIKKNKVDYPSFIPEEAKDLISKILVEDPKKRLGNGEVGSSNDMKALKSHPYFENIKFDQLKSTEVPYTSDFRIVMTKQSQNVANFSQEEDKIHEEEQYKFREKTKTISTIKQALLDKKSPWLHYNKRKIVLDSTPKIEYIEPKRNIVKGVIYLNKKCKAEHINLSVFDLITPKRTFRFKVR